MSNDCDFLLIWQKYVILFFSPRYYFSEDFSLVDSIHVIIKAKIGKRSKSEYFCHKLLLYEMEVLERHFLFGVLTLAFFNFNLKFTWWHNFVQLWNCSANWILADSLCIIFKVLAGKVAMCCIFKDRDHTKQVPLLCLLHSYIINKQNIKQIKGFDFNIYNL